MGGQESKPTVLRCMLKNFKKGFSSDYEVKITPSHLRTLCEIEWPSFAFGWPDTGTLDVQMVQAVWNLVTGTPGIPCSSRILIPG